MSQTSTTESAAPGQSALSNPDLEAWLQVKINRRPLVRSLSALDGFVTAVVAGPSLPNPLIPIFAALGLTADTYHDPGAPGWPAVYTAINLFNRISKTLSEQPEDFQPNFVTMPDGGIDPRPWCQAFYTAVEFNRKVWKPLLNPSSEFHGLLLPIFIYCKNKTGRPVLGAPRSGPETDAFLEHEAHTDIAIVVPAIREHHHTTFYDKPAAIFR